MAAGVVAAGVAAAGAVVATVDGVAGNDEATGPPGSVAVGSVSAAMTAGWAADDASVSRSAYRIRRWAAV